ncbi:ABC transporter permease [Paenibacillus sp. MBLB4367]|uniref:ABC transporter permease n=1 Tax=Paenibacillus sp. MBLB4367 TaxID=3384767 RepID=UPI003907EAD0
MSTADKAVKADKGYRGWLRFCWTSWKLNAAGAMEFRMSFMMTAGMMFINNLVWIFFWSIYFKQFPIVNGWQQDDVMMMWAVGTAGYGLAAIFFGNMTRIANIVATGQLDLYLSQPKPVLLNVLVSRMSVTAIGDLVFGLLLYAIFGDGTPAGVLKFVSAALLSTVIFLFFMVATQSLAFYIGNAEGLGQQLFITFITFSTYPTDIFRGFARLLLFTAVPAGFVSYLPIGWIREFQPAFALGAVGAAAGLAAVGIGLFYRGLRRYSSGNALGMRM